MIQLTEAAAGALQSAIATVPRPIAGLRLVVRSGSCARTPIRDGPGGTLRARGLLLREPWSEDNHRSISCCADIRHHNRLC
jgi:hypothetical protein